MPSLRDMKRKAAKEAKEAAASKQQEKERPAGTTKVRYHKIYDRQKNETADLKDKNGIVWTREEIGTPCSCTAKVAGKVISANFRVIRGVIEISGEDADWYYKHVR